MLIIATGGVRSALTDPTDPSWHGIGDDLPTKIQLDRGSEFVIHALPMSDVRCFHTTYIPGMAVALGRINRPKLSALTFIAGHGHESDV